MKKPAKLYVIVPAAVAVILAGVTVWFLFFRGHFNESDFERIRKSMKLGGRELSFPLDTGDPGGGLSAEIRDKAQGREYGAFYCGGKKVIDFSADALSHRTRWIQISCDHSGDDYDTELIKTFEIDGLTFGDSEMEARAKYGSPQNEQENGSEKVLEYIVYKNDRIWKNLELTFDDGKLTEIYVFEFNG